VTAQYKLRFDEIITKGVISLYCGYPHFERQNAKNRRTSRRFSGIAAALSDAQ
jgi:hypothetical protein